MKTNINWNTEIPKFEDVEGKTVLVKYVIEALLDEIDRLNAAIESWKKDEVINAEIVERLQSQVKELIETGNAMNVEAYALLWSRTHNIDLSHFNHWNELVSKIEQGEVTNG